MLGGYVADGQYLRHYSAVTGSGTTQTYTFDGPTQLSDGTPTYAFAGIPFATASGAPFVAVAVTFVGSGASTLRTHYVYTQPDGSIYLDDTDTYDASGRPLQVYDTGHVFDGQAYGSHRDTYSAAGALTQQVFYDRTGAVYLTSIFDTSGGINHRNDYNPAGQIVHEYYTTASGQLYLDATLAYSGATVTMRESGLMITNTGFGSRTEIYGQAANSSLGSLKEQLFYDDSGNAVLDQVRSADGLTLTSTGSYFDGRAYNTVLEEYRSPRTGYFELGDRVFLNRDGSVTDQAVEAGFYTSRSSAGTGAHVDDIYDFRSAVQGYLGPAGSNITFNAGFGHDQIYGFRSAPASPDDFFNHEFLTFSRALFSTLDQLRAAAHPDATNPADLVITDAQNDTLVLHGVLVGHTINDVLNSGDTYFR